MKIELKQFQKRTIQKLLIEVKEFERKGLNNKNPKSILLEACTGSGKTIILAKFIEDFLKSANTSKSFGFIWLTPGKGDLHTQTKNKIAEFLGHSMVQVVFFDEVLQHSCFPKDTVAVVNWEKINRKTNTIFSNNEKFNFTNFLANTKLNTTLIAIVDEEHYAQTVKTNKVIDLFAPSLIIRTSATPKKGNFDIFIQVDRHEVVEEELILERYKLNDNFEQFTNQPADNIMGENAFLLSAALVKRTELLSAYREENSKVNPLIIVQLPDEKTEYETELKEQTKSFFINKQIKFDNQLLAIHLDKEKENIFELSKNDGNQIVVITKQAITHGWDCPRAQILVKLRHHSAKRFNIQSLGRIARVPEPAKGFYQNEILNTGYVYIFDQTFIEILKDPSINDSLLKYAYDLQIKSKWKKETLPIPLPNQIKWVPKEENTVSVRQFASEFNIWFRKRKDKKTVSANSETMQKFLTDNFGSLHNSTVSIKYEEGEITGTWYDKKVIEKTIIADYKKEGIYFLSKKFKYDFCYFLATRLQQRNKEFINEVFEYLFSKNILNWEDYRKTDVEYLYDFAIWKEEKRYDRSEQEAFFYCFLLNSRDKWLDLLKTFCKEQSKGRLIAMNEQLKKEKMEDFYFPEYKKYYFAVKDSQNNEYLKLNPNKNNNLYQDFIRPDTHDFSQPEVKFIDAFLESYSSGSKIDWWYRNTENEKTSWKIIYIDRNYQYRNFYPDFILKIKNDFWIIEVKDTSGLDQNNQEKFNYLKQFCDTHNLQFAFVIANSGQDVKFNNTKWNADFTSSEWEVIDQIFTKPKTIMKIS